MIKININYKVSFDTDFYTGGGKGNSYINSYVLKDNKGEPFIPGSLIKGKLRYFSEMIANSINNDELACSYNSNHNKNYEMENIDCKCSICLIYGWGGNRKGLLNFYNAALSEGFSGVDYFKTRTGTIIDRFSKTVKHKALYTIETTIDGFEFEGKINGFLPKNTYKRELYLLRASFLMIDTIGGNQSRGLGFVNSESKIFDVYIDGNLKNKFTNWEEAERECFSK